MTSFRKAAKLASLKNVILGKKWKSKKHTKINSQTTLELFYAKDGSKYHLIFEKYLVFEPCDVDRDFGPTIDFGRKV